MALVINNNNAVFDGSIFLKFDSIPREDDLLETISDCCMKYHDESGGQRPNIALALLRQQIKLGSKHDSDVATALREFAKTFNQSEIEELFSLARPAFDEMRYKIMLYSDDYRCFIEFFDQELIKDKSRYETFLIEFVPDIWNEDNWFILVRELIRIKSKKTENIISETIPDVERFRGRLMEDYFRTSFYHEVFSVCSEHNFKKALSILYKELGSYYFYADSYYLESLPHSKNDSMYWGDDYVKDFEEGYIQEFKTYDWSNGEAYKYSINLNKEWFSQGKEIQEIIRIIEKHNSKIKDQHYEEFLRFDELSESVNGFNSPLESFNQHLFSNEGFINMSQDYQVQFIKNLGEFLEQLIAKDEEIPITMAYEILSKEYLESIHPMIYRSIGDHNKDPIALMKRIALAVFLGEDFRSYSKLLIGLIDRLNAKEKAYFKEMFLTQGSGIRNDLIKGAYYLDSPD